MIKDYSFGVIPVYTDKNGNYEFLIINQKTYNGNFWGFPKGHAENGENGLETAIRELEEEVGIKNINIDKNKFESFSYDFEEKGIKYYKTVKYRLGFVKNKDVIIQKEELNGYKRTDYNNTLRILSHTNMQNTFKNMTK